MAGKISRLILLALILLTFSSISSDAGEYWQQEVNYDMDIELADDLRTIAGSIEIEYINNSPDTLDLLYLKAWPNAIQKGSYADLKRRKQNNYSFANLTASQEGSLEISNLVGQSVTRPIEVDNSVIRVLPDRSILPGDTAYLKFDFTTVLPNPPQMRMGSGRGVAKGVYWFPQVCVYDHKLGWCNTQYLGWGEWYGDYGSYDVRITAAEDQIVAATGLCVNESEVLPDSLRKMLDIGNFMRSREDWPVFEFDRSNKKTWHYVAENVPDFTFTSSAHFCIDSGSVNGVQVVSYPLRHNARRWVQAVQFGEESVETFSELYIPYQWPIVRICDAYSGMEYPMLTNCSHWGNQNGFRMLLYHEIGHNWFMGHVGSNQTDRPCLDEGFTTHAEHVIMEKYLGRLGNMDHFTSWYERKFAPPSDDRIHRGFRPLLEMYTQGYDKPMVHSYDHAPEYFPARVAAYYKGAAMHYSLRSLLGDSAYFDAMQHYCRKWLFKHPYEDDFTEAMEEATGLNLEEFFRQWFHGRQQLDYAFAGKKSTSTNHNYTHTIKVKREGNFVSPVDVAVIWQQGDTTFYTVPPEGMEYTKPGCIVLPVWKQFRTGEEEYEFVVKARRDIDKIVVDPHELLMDVNRLNNQSGLLFPIQVRFDNMKYDRTPIGKYALRWRPDIWYDEPNGLQVGFHSHGSYLAVDKGFDLDARLGTESIRPVVDLSFFGRETMFGNNARSEFHILRSDRRIWFSSAVEKRFKKLYSRPDQHLFRAGFSSMGVSGDYENRLVPLPDDVAAYLPQPVWDDDWVYTLGIEYASYKTFRYGSLTIGSRDLIGDYEENDRHQSFVEMNHYAELDLSVGKGFELGLRAAMFDMTGEPPTQYLYHLSRVQAVERFVRSPLFRNPGTFPTDWEDDFYLAGNGVRGYQDRNIYFTEAFSGSLSLTPPDLLPYRWLRGLPLIGRILGYADNSFFVDAARVSFDGKEEHYQEWISSDGSLAADGKSTTYISAGLSLEFPPVWSGQRLRVDFPLYLNKPVTGDEEFDFRFSVAWLLPGHFD